MSKRKRMSYTLEFKLKVITKSDEVGNREAGRLFDVDESNVRLWRKNREKLENNSCRKRRSFRYGTPSWPNLEEELNRWILSEREKGVPISTVKIHLKAKVMAQEMNIENFQGGPTWCYRFMKRKNLSVRSRTTVGQKLPENWEELSNNFLEYTRKLISESKFNESQIINMDEVPLSFDSPPNRTVASIGSTSVPVCTTGNEKTSFTVVLACSASGEKLHPMIIFKRKTIPKENFPPELEIRANEKGWMNQDIMISWLKNVWRKRKGCFFKPHALLIMDSMKAHIKENIKSACKASGAKISIIPGGLTKRLQPLDIGINRSFKNKVRNCWEKWMTEGIHSFTKSGKIRRASYLEVCLWVKEAWDGVSESTIKNSFKKSGLIVKNSADSGSEFEDDDASQLNEDILKLFDSESDSSEFDGFH